MPAPRRKYDITSTEILEIARSAADLVVDEIRARAEETLPHQLYELQRISQQLAVAAGNLGGRADGAESTSIEPALVQLRAAIVGDLAEQQRLLAEALDRRLDSIASSAAGSAGVDDQLPARIAAAVVAAISTAAPDNTSDRRVAEMQGQLAELLGHLDATETSRVSALDRLDTLVLDLKSGIAEGVTRQHAILLGLLDERLDEVHFREIADALPERVGSVITDALREHVGTALDAGLERQRSVLSEISTATTGMRVETSAMRAEHQSLIEELRTSQQALTEELRTSQQALTEELRSSQNTLADELGSSQQALVETLRTSQHALVAELRSSQQLLVEEMRVGQRALVEEMRGDLRVLGEEVSNAMAAGLSRQEAALGRVREVEQVVIDMAERLPEMVVKAIAGGDGAGGDSPVHRVERSVNEVVWSLGELQATNQALLEEMARIVAELPGAAAALRDAATRSEARLTDLVLRLSTSGGLASTTRGKDQPAVSTL